MFPIYGSNSRFTYDNLHEVRLDPLWISLASTLVAAFLVMAALSAGEQPPVESDSPDVDMAFVTPIETGAEAMIETP